mmetsp:Transcript_35247/g.77198  ORF Transcript_35247/g.77198 Transcript_35247/m.77198 type:complete len:379 (+) Transcript_35247:54-1190(+)|eukprot:CAMPEP_0178473468 /NCGR_PEP_ID=MMETSP0696-20121128/2102_1 /TAXON_ID=265572 /ORGANISM="Extubocellulus spinifer, Strain CCMP396" /LENGTH=378 /DNA_ID=CAMNT_0020100691 /DNA_START=40 /DNA_END=1176 /DNA_ORIENTATION=-
MNSSTAPSKRSLNKAIKSSVATLKSGMSFAESPSPPSPMEDDLRQYVQIFQPGSGIVTTINAMLDNQYNTCEAASELCDYYRDRPDLKAYTLLTEVPRLSYVVISSDGKYLLSPGDIQDFFLKKEMASCLNHSEQCEVEELLLRASNQSLFADALAAITGDGLIVQPHKFRATALASVCQFTIDLRPDTWRRRKHVEATCDFDVCVPLSMEKKLHLASVKLSLFFSPSSPNKEPLLRYRILQVENHIDINRESHCLRKVSNHLEADDVKECTSIGRSNSYIVASLRKRKNCSTHDLRKCFKDKVDMVDSFFRTCQQIDARKDDSGTRKRRVSEAAEWLSDDILVEHMVVEQQIALAQYRQATIVRLESAGVPAAAQRM